MWTSACFRGKFKNYLRYKKIQGRVDSGYSSYGGSGEWVPAQHKYHIYHINIAFLLQNVL